MYTDCSSNKCMHFLLQNKKCGTRHFQRHEVFRKYGTLFYSFEVVKMVPDMAKNIFLVY